MLGSNMQKHVTSQPISKRMKQTHWQTGCIFECSTCGKQFQGQTGTRRQAYNHAMKTGHEVMGDITICFHYN